jgi:Putative zinc-finger
MPCPCQRCAMHCLRARLQDDRPLRRNVDCLIGIKTVKLRVAAPSEMPQITCRRFVESLSAWCDGELTEAARIFLEAHRARCTRCTRYAAGFGAAIALLKSALADSAARTEFPEDLAQAILTACRETN